jgi:hypothetical protein
VLEDGLRDVLTYALADGDRIDRRSDLSDRGLHQTARVASRWHR